MNPHTPHQYVPSARWRHEPLDMFEARLAAEHRSATVAQAIHWAKRNARKLPGVQFIARVGDTGNGPATMYCYEVDDYGEYRRIE